METKGIVLLGLHRSTDEQVFSRHVAKAGYKPVALFDTSAIIDMFGRTGVHACIMDLNFKHPNKQFFQTFRDVFWIPFLLH